MSRTLPLYQQISHLRSVSFELVDELVTSNLEGAGRTPSVALTHMQDVANKLGLIESLLATQARTG